MTEMEQTENTNLTEREKLSRILLNPTPLSSEEQHRQSLTNLTISIKDRELREGKLRHNEIAKMLNQLDHYKTMKDTDELYVYRNGVYIKEGELLIKRIVEQICSETVSRSYVSEIIACIKRKNQVDREIFDSAPDLLVVENGILNIDTLTLAEHTPDHLSLKKLHRIYDPDARATEILKFLDIIVSKKDSQKLKEFIGYLLEPSYFIQKTFMLHGEANRGKSTFCNLLIKFLGQENISNTPLRKLTSDLGKAQLYGKIANISDELAQELIENTADFKGLCGESLIEARFLYRNIFRFYNTAKLIFTSNEIPITQDLTDAFFKRWILIPFLTQFYHNAEPRIIPNYIDQLTTEEELSGLLNIALENRLELKQNGQFSFTNSIEENREFWTILSDPIYRFIETYCDTEQNAWLDKDDFFLKFSRYLTENNIPTLSQHKVTSRMKKKYSISERGSRGQQKEGWFGIKWKESEEGLKKYDNN